MALAAGGYGIANEKRWGYGLAVGHRDPPGGRAARVRAAATCSAFPLILTLIFDVALVALLVHPESREYQRIWFK